MGKEKDSQETLPPHQKKKGGGIHPGLLRVNSAEDEIPEREKSWRGGPGPALHGPFFRSACVS